MTKMNISQEAKRIRDLIDAENGPRPDGAPLWDDESDEIQKVIENSLKTAFLEGKSSNFLIMPDDQYASGASLEFRKGWQTFKDIFCQINGLESGISDK